MAKKGGKRSKGKPAFYDEMKKRVNLTLTPTGFDGLDNLALERGLSKSEFVEQIGRGLIPVIGSQEVERLGEFSEKSLPSFANS